MDYEAVVLVGFGGPEGMDEVMPFLDNVLRGKNVPEARKQEVAHHYELFGGISPINEQMRKLKAAMEGEFSRRGLALPVYWGNRNWQPLLSDVVNTMKADGIRRALGFIPSAYSSYSGCRQYREDIQHAREAVGENAPEIDKIRVFYNHPKFIAANADRLRDALAECAGDVTVLYCAHSLPVAMADRCRYVEQLMDTCSEVSKVVGVEAWRLVYQSRSGPPFQPWLEPDICDVIRELAEVGHSDVVVAPVGFVSDHMEVVFDLDTEARGLCGELGIQMHRAQTVGVHPDFISMVGDLVEERLCSACEPAARGAYAPSPDQCAEDCCLPR